MNEIFPFGFPGPTAFYLVLYVATFAVHHAIMHYVLAGSLYLVWAAVFRGTADISRNDQPLAKLLKDWMPFSLSAAITAGVAPLLFIQILYPRQFYTANLLLSWRWMIVVPVLVVVFYLLYIIKSKAVSTWPCLWRTVLAILSAACFLFVGFCWTANHLLSVSESTWTDVYVSGRLPFDSIEVTLRIAVWIAIAFCTLANVGAWQVERSSCAAHLRVVELRRLSVMAIGGTGSAAIVGTVYLMRSPEEVRSALMGWLAMPYIILFAIASAIHVATWVVAFRLQKESVIRPLLLATFAWAIAIVAASVVREVIRLVAIDATGLAERHQAAKQVGGFVLFVISFVVNTTLIVVCVVIVRRSIAHSDNKSA